MSSASTDPSLAREMAALLAWRAAELRRMLQDAAAVPDAPPEVVDFKDLAAQETQEAVDDVGRAHAASELTQVLEALRRLAEGSYGSCLDCGEPIPAQRLRTLPAAPYCTACQASRERAGSRQAQAGRPASS